MKSEEKEFLSALQEGMRSLGIELTSAAEGRILGHFRCLLLWAASINLTTLRDPRVISEELYLDSAYLHSRLPTQAKIHDVGTGGGFPGLVLKALAPERALTLSEARSKKVAFLKAAVREMGLKSGEGLEVRWETFSKETEGPGGVFDHAVSKATFDPLHWLDLASRDVVSGGQVWLMLSADQWEKERSNGIEKKAMELFLQSATVSPYCLPGLRADRVLVSFTKEKQSCFPVVVS